MTFVFDSDSQRSLDLSKMIAITNKNFKWSLDFTRSRHEKSVNNVSPPGYKQLACQNGTELSKNSGTRRLIIKKSWDRALGPLKQMPINVFIMYMAGNSISIFPIMIVGMLIVRSLKSLFYLLKTFKPIKETQEWGQKFIFFMGHCVNIALAMYKCQSMGLLPTHASDWLAFFNAPTSIEYSGGGFALC